MEDKVIPINKLEFKRVKCFLTYRFGLTLREWKISPGDVYKRGEV